MKRLTAILTVVALFFTPTFAMAATVSDIYNLPSTLTASEPSNHTIVLTNTANVDEGDTLTLTFPNDFTETSLSYTDVDIADDGVDLTVAADCTGSDQASFSQSSDASNVIYTFTICSGDGGAIAAGSSIQIELGRHATSGASGVSRIQNPSVAGSYFLSLGGTYGDTGTIVMPIVSASEEIVSGIIPGVDDGGGGGGGCCRGIDDDSVDDEDPVDPDPEDSADPIDPEDVIDPDEPEDPIEPVDEEDAGEEEKKGDEIDVISDPDPEDPADPIEPTDPIDGGEEDDTEPDDGVVDEKEINNPPVDEGGDPDDGGSNADTRYAAPSIEVTPIRLNGALSLIGGAYQVLGGETLIIRIVPERPGALESLRILYDGLEIELDRPFQTSLLPKEGATLIVVAEYETGQVIESSARFSIIAAGTVVTGRGGNERIVQDVSLRILNDNGEEILNTIDADGVFGLYVANGSYQLIASRADLSEREVTVRVQNNILAPSIRLLASEIDIPLIPEGVEDAIIEPIIIGVEEVRDRIEDFRATEIAEDTAAIAAPVAIGTAVVSAAVLGSSFQLFAFLQYILSAPVLFIARRRKYAFGTVYNSANKLPLDLATVRLLSKEGKLLRSKVTDRSGRYFFHIAPGEYRLVVQKQGYIAPSQIVKVKKDGPWDDVYLGEAVPATAEHPIIAKQIPADPQNEAKSKRGIRFRILLRVLQHAIAISGVLISLYVFLVTQSLLSLGLVILQVLVYALTKALIRPVQRPSFSFVYGPNGKPVQGAVVRLFEPKFNKLIESAITDGKGRFAFLVGPNTYYLRIEDKRLGTKTTDPIDYSAETGARFITVNVTLGKNTDAV